MRTYSLIPAIAITLLIEPPKLVGIMPFKTKPEIIAWENRVFLPIDEDINNNQYTETTFGLAAQENQNTIARLELSTGEYVASVKIPSSLPGVIRWGERIFKRVGGVYREAFCATAYELVSDEEIKKYYEHSAG